LSRIFLAIPNKSEGFPTSGNDTENKYSISDALRSLLQGSSLSSREKRGFHESSREISDVSQANPAYGRIRVQDIPEQIALTGLSPVMESLFATNTAIVKQGCS